VRNRIEERRREEKERDVGGRGGTAAAESKNAMGGNEQAQMQRKRTAVWEKTKNSQGHLLQPNKPKVSSQPF